MYDSPAFSTSDLLGVLVEAGDAEARAGELHDERQADVADADDDDVGGLVLDLLEQGHGGIPGGGAG